MRRLKGLAALLMTAAVLSACSKEAAAPVETSEVQTEVETSKPVEIVLETTAAETEAAEGYFTPEERVEEDGKIRSYLTGELVDAAIGNRRPVAVMMSNDKAALPQYGLGHAGVVYEAPAEGGMNRYMALIEDYDNLERIGSVRSCRTYYTYFAREFEAIYAHFGQSTFAVPYLKNVDNINGLDAIGDTAYYRSKDKKSPHNAYTSGERLAKAIEKLGYSSEYPEDYQGHYRFARGNYVLDDLPGVQDAVKIVNNCTLNKPWFVYNEEDGLYHRYQYGSAHRSNEGEIAVKNVIFQYCPTGRYATTEYLNINVHANEYGYYFTNGKAIPITWKKDGELGVTRYYDHNNNEIILNQGKTWVCIIPTADFDKTEIYGKEQ